jgi:hypothetical protein
MSGFAFPLAWQVLKALAAIRQFSLFHQHHGKIIFDAKAQGAPLTNKAFLFKPKPRIAGIERAPQILQHLKQLVLIHAGSCFTKALGPWR